MQDVVEVPLQVVLVADVPEEDGLVEACPAEGALHRRPRPHPLLRDGRHGDDDGRRGRPRSGGGTGSVTVASHISPVERIETLLDRLDLYEVGKLDHD